MATFERPATPDAWAGLKFSRVIPTLHVNSIEDSIKFYTKRLPFYLSGRDSNDHCWLTVHGSNAVNPFTGLEQGSVNVYLRRHGFVSRYERAEGEVKEEVKGTEDNGSGEVGKGIVYIRLDGNEEQFRSFYKTIENSGIVADQHHLRATPWGTLTFGVNDLDRNHIRFYVSLRSESRA
ncbi:hypothetical protein DFH28DRAFT_963216 [Melampsora americana]|nr:hypothetical protein DFH28DRAFT_963216 [Melampsora americana]